MPSLEAFPQLITYVLNETNRLAQSGNTHVNAGALHEEYVRYRRAVKTVNSAAFRSELSRIRNSVAAHHLTSSNSSIDGLVEWVNAHAPAAGRSTQWIDNPVISRDLSTRRLPPPERRRLPEIPTSVEEYERKKTALDNADASDADA